jgi:hypothetical protein
MHRFFYPYPLTSAFSDSLLGSAPIFAVFRFLGLSRETAFQGWYIFGYFINYIAAAYSLLKLKLSPLAAAAGAFFFSFGLPMLAQENHAQLLYRFCVPLASMLLWNISNKPRLRTILILFSLIVWQFYLSIYIGYFLVLLLVVMMILMPRLNSLAPKENIIKFWPNIFREAWENAGKNEKTIFFIGMLLIISFFSWLIYPYIRVSNLYHFFRSAEEIETLLPRIQSYLLANHSQLWQSNSPIFSNIPSQHEHQLFPGISIYILIVIGILWNFPSENRNYAILNIVSAFILILFTLNINGLSFYKLIISIPGINSIRAITRIQLVLMWPIAVFAACVIDSFYKKMSALFNFKTAAYFLCSILIIESVLINHNTFSKKDAQVRTSLLREQIKQKMDISNFNPIIFVGTDNNDPWYVTELDSMLVSQELDIPTLNGYSGNLLYGFGVTSDCIQLPIRILKFLEYTKTDDENVYFDLINRVVPFRLSNCDSTWLNKFPADLQKQLEQE